MAGIAPAAAAPFAFESFFDGRLTGSGTVDNRREGTHRAFTATLAAHWQGPHGTLVEDLTYADGETKRFAWTFDRTGAGRYIGHRDDLVGEADVTTADGALRMTYTAHTTLPSGAVWTLSFDDRFEQIAPATVTVTGAVSYLFLGVGATHMTIVKAPR
jgi:hypothetical protein